MSAIVRDAAYGRQVRDACAAMLPEFRPFLAAVNRDFGPVAWSACSLPRKLTEEEKRLHCGDRAARQRARDADRIAATQRERQP